MASAAALAFANLWGNRSARRPPNRCKPSARTGRRPVKHSHYPPARFNDHVNNRPPLLLPWQSRLVQSNLAGEALSSKDSDTFGHQFPLTPNPNTTIVTFQNIGPQKNSGVNGKSTHNARAFKKSNAGVSLYAEHCLNESKLTVQDSFTYRMRRYNPHSFSYLVNNHNAVTTAPWNQTGGTGFTLNQQMTSHKLDHGCDPTGLGRWTFVRFKGKHNTTICMISAYRPCRTTTCLGSVWNQQRRYFQDHMNNSDPDPRALFDTHLLAEVSTRLTAGDAVLLGVDNNADVRTSSLAIGLLDLGFRDAVLSAHSPASPPATHNRNQSRTPIDAIWISPTIEVSRTGYCPFDGIHGMDSDHRLLWVELDNTSILGKYLPPTHPVLSSRVKSSDPRSRNLYISRVTRHYRKANVPIQCRDIQVLVNQVTRGQTHLMPILLQAYNKLHKTTTDIRNDVEAKLRTLNNGQVPWSPRLQRYRNIINYWTCIVKLRKSVNTSRSQLKRLAQRLGIYKGFHVTLEYAELKLSESRDSYYKMKPRAEQWRIEHNQSLVDALVTEGKASNKSAAQIRARMKREKKAIADGKAARAIRGRNTKHSVLMATVTDDNGNERELHSQEEMVPAMAASNLARQQQCLGTPSMEPLFISEFGYLAEKPAAAEVIAGTYPPPLS